MIDIRGQTIPPLQEPNYSARNLTAGIVHIGLGNFHRAHQAWYLHRLMQQGLALDWAIIGAGVRPYDQEMRAKLQRQGYRTTLIELDTDNVSAEVVGSMKDYISVDEGNASLIERMAQPDIRIVSTTITEGGYYIRARDKSFDTDHADIAHDVENANSPKTAFGAIIAALKARREAGYAAFTCQSCDNLQGNGNIMRQTVLALARLSSVDLADWIEENVTFPNSMVDCIVPATGERELALAHKLGINEEAPVTHERYRQWVMEDKFCAGRPDWQRVGAVFSDNVAAYEAMKIRILNGGHQIIAAAGDLLGIATISATMEHTVLRDFFHQVVRNEILPHVHRVAEYSCDEYLVSISERFANKAIFDTTRRVAFDGSSRQSEFLIPSIKDNLAKEGSAEGLALVSSIWARYCLGEREDGSAIMPNDPNWSQLNERARFAKERPEIWLQNTAVYGDLAHNAAFREAFSQWLDGLYREGVEAMLQQYLLKTHA